MHITRIYARILNLLNNFRKDEFISSLRDVKEELLRQNEEFKKKISEIEKRSNENQELIMEELEKLKKEERPQKKKWSFWK